MEIEVKDKILEETDSELQSERIKYDTNEYVENLFDRVEKTHKRDSSEALNTELYQNKETNTGILLLIFYQI